MEIYIATCLERRAEAEALAGRLRALGCTITSQWHATQSATRELERCLDLMTRTEIAVDNYTDVEGAELLVFLSDPRCRGSLCEVAHANALGVEVLCVGDPLAATLMLAPHSWVADVEALLAYVARRRGVSDVA